MLITTGRSALASSVLWAIGVAQGSETAARAQKVAPSIINWGPYRPNLYVGIKPLVPETLLFGLMWANGDDRSSMLQSTEFPLSLEPYLRSLLTSASGKRYATLAREVMEYMATVGQPMSLALEGPRSCMTLSYKSI
jgi:hypothetical protein